MTLNLPNILTLSRVPLMFIVVGLMYADCPWCDTLAFWLFIAAALTDWLEDTTARLARERGFPLSLGGVVRLENGAMDDAMAKRGFEVVGTVRAKVIA